MSDHPALTWYPRVFDRDTEAESRKIILTPEPGITSEERWERESAFLEPILDSLPKGLILDFGCGIGRLSKLLIRQGQRVIGIDTSQTMREQAIAYVASSAWFTAMTGDEFERFGPLFSADAAIAVWVLQHIPSPWMPGIVNSIADALKPLSPFLVINRVHRVIPTVDNAGDGVWLDDQYDVDGALLKRFDLISDSPMPEILCAPGAYLRFYRSHA